MRKLANWLKEGLVFLGICLLLVLGLVLVAVLARFVMILAIVAMFGVFIVSLFRPKVRAWFETPGRGAAR